MAAALVVLLSLLVGAATYVATIRLGRRVPAAIGFEGVSSAAAVALVPAAPGEEPDERGSRAPEAEAEVLPLAPARAPADDEVARDDDDASGTGASATPATAGDATAEPIAPVAATPLPRVGVTSPTFDAPDPGYAYLRVVTDGPSWRDRLAGVVGIAVLLVIGAAGIAFGIYQLGSAINSLVQRFLNG